MCNTGLVIKPELDALTRLLSVDLTEIERLFDMDSVSMAKENLTFVNEIRSKLPEYIMALKDYENDDVSGIRELCEIENIRSKLALVERELRPPDLGKLVREA